MTNTSLSVDTTEIEQQIEHLRLLLEGVPDFLLSEAQGLCLRFVESLGSHLVLGDLVTAGATGLHFAASFGSGYHDLVVALRALDGKRSEVVNSHGVPLRGDVVEDSSSHGGLP